MLNYSKDKKRMKCKERKRQITKGGGNTTQSERKKERKSNSNSPVMDNASEQPQK